MGQGATGILSVHKASHQVYLPTLLRDNPQDGLGMALYEVAALCTLVSELSPEQNIVEIGTGLGRSTKAMRYVTRAEIWTIDMEKRAQPLIEQLQAQDDLGVTNFCHGRSNAIRKQWPNDRKIALLFIDGLHNLEGARDDWSRWHALVESGGIIAMHDVDDFDTRPRNGPTQLFWGYIADTLPHFSHIGRLAWWRTNQPAAGKPVTISPDTARRWDAAARAKKVVVQKKLGPARSRSGKKLGPARSRSGKKLGPARSRSGSNAHAAIGKKVVVKGQTIIMRAKKRSKS